jgi:hypothetical protein
MRTPEELERLKKIRNEAAAKIADFISKEVDQLFLGHDMDKPPDDDQLAKLIGLAFGAWKGSKTLSNTFGLDAWTLSDEMSGDVAVKELKKVGDIMISLHAGGMKN